MATGSITDTERELIRSALAPLVDASEVFDSLTHGLRMAEAASREIDRVRVDLVARLARGGGFTERGQRVATGVADLLGVESVDAHRLVVAAEELCPRVGLTGETLPPRLPATAAAFARGALGLRHVGVIARLLRSGAAARLDASVWETAEEQLAGLATQFTPADVHTMGGQLIERFDQDGQQPEDREPEQVNELRLTPDRRRGGGWVKGKLSPTGYAALSALLDAKAAPLTKEDTRPVAQRQGDALAEICEWVATHSDTALLPTTGGERPQLNVHVDYEDLRRLGRGAMLDFGGQITPAELRRLCCDADVTPIVLGGAGQPLDIGRHSRVIPRGLRRAVTARDRGCAHPGCDRPISWVQIHHVIPWEKGGETEINNLVALCLLHHREIHSSQWVVRIAADGIPEFVPPKWVDPDQIPRRKPNLHRNGTPETGQDP